jgi:ATP-dependent Clp protease protease subunit
MKSLLLALLLLPVLSFGKTITLSENNTISFNQAFTSQYVAQKQQELFNLALTSQEEDLYIVMYTPGGSVSAGSLFIDSVNALGKRVHTITIFSASMGYHTVQGLGNRYILPSGQLMSHRASVRGLGGQFPGELNTRIDMLMSSTALLDEAAAKRVGLKLEEYKNLIHDELWLTGKNAVDAGHADQVVNAKCDESLMGTKIEQMATIFGLIDVQFSKCPLIVGPLGIAGDSESVVKHVQDHYFSNIATRIKTEL